MAWELLYYSHYEMLMEATDLSMPAKGIAEPITTGADWYVRPFEPGDEDGLLALYERAFKRPRDRSHWRWKLLGRKAAFNLLWVAAIRGSSDGPNERIVGHYGGIPIQLKLGHQTFEAVHAVEAMTDPEFRRKGMLTALGSSAHSTWAEDGQLVVTGLPNDQWGTRNRALGYLPVYPLSWLRFPLHMERALAKRESLPIAARTAGYLPALIGSALWRTLGLLGNRMRGGSVTVKLVQDDSTIFDALWDYASGGWTNVQVRDTAWVQWRYLRAAPSPYKVAVAYSGENDGSLIPIGYVAFRVIDHGERRNGYIADLFVRRGDIGAAWSLVKFALEHLSNEGAGTVMTLAPPGSELYSAMRKFGFLPTKNETAFSFELVPLSPDVSVESLANPADWHLTGGDFDVI